MCVGKSNYNYCFLKISDRCPAWRTAPLTMWMPNYDFECRCTLLTDGSARFRLPPLMSAKDSTKWLYGLRSEQLDQLNKQ
ncbi:hypothetical protein M514_11377 [Trichuris suis]|uniref:Uncharacterized protein n=1 Tax=Trichuris suis TaxID=68888 RepID=A0A085NDE4_9BILA|nr:hypothetical protein M513_11377 [Trichuris suis]KFD67490.1 hypothetical protein M514_11377 [Trichuris suis]